MAHRRRPTYAPEFRAEALKRVRNSTASVTQIARDLGVTSGTLRRWIDASRPPPEVPLTDDERSELRRLRKENRELRMEREILKKGHGREPTHESMKVVPCRSRAGRAKVGVYWC
jgi:transposase